jgi:serralysin
MKSRFFTDPLDTPDSSLGTAWDEIYTHAMPSTADNGGRASAPVPVMPPTPTLPSEAVEAESAQSGPTTVVAETSGSGITINLVFDAAAMAAPASFRAGIEQAAAILSATITNQITVNINIDYSGTGGGAAAGPDNGQYINYSTVRSDLINDVAPGDPTFDALPTGSTFQGQSSVAVWNAQLKALGLLAPTANTDDGSATFATDINSNLLVGVALHELTHALGRVPYGPTPGSPTYTPQPDIFDFFRFTAPGTPLILNGATAPAAYFSVDGGNPNTKLADYGQTSDSSDFLNSGVQGPNDPFNEFYTGSTSQTLSTVDKEQLDALGFNLASPVFTVIESVGSTSLAGLGNNYYLDSNGIAGSGISLKYAGAAVVAGQFGVWAPIGAEATASGYEVAFKATGADQYSVWVTDRSGNFISSSAAMSGAGATLESFESSFHQDLNGDGVIGIPTTTVIEAFGSTSLTEVGINFYLYTGGSGPSLKYAGANVVAGQFGAWAPIGAEATATGYEVAFKATGADQYSVWVTDSSGNFISSSVAMSGASATLESFESSFHQDLNGDGAIGVPTGTIVIESFGSTALVQVGANYFLDSISSGTGPELEIGGAVIVAGQFGAWTPIGAEQVAGGYDVAWKVPGSDSYAVWSTDSSGNYVSTLLGNVPGANAALEAIETTFHQDLNGDGVIGVPATVTTVIEAFGSTKLVQVGANYYLDSVSSGTGPELEIGGAVIVAGQFGAWTPIGAEQVAGGYDVAWKVPGSDSYAVWSTDSSGNYVSTLLGNVPGANAALEAIETTFHQDLNGDGVIGVPASTNPAPAAAGAGSAPATFTGATLTLDASSPFSGQIIGFAGDGTLQGSDQIDLRGMNYNSIHSTYDGAAGILAVNDGTNTTDLQFLGNYSQASFKFADDGGIVYAQVGSGQPPLLGGAGAAPIHVAGNNVSTAGQDTFVFAPNFGQVSIAHFAPETDTIQISKTVFANIDALLAATHDDSHGSAVIADAAHDTITIQSVTTAQLQAHQSDFHLV